MFDLASLERGIPDAAYKPLSGDDPAAAKVAGKVNRLQREQANQGDLLGRLSARELAREAEEVRAMPEDDVAALAAKATAYSRLRAQAGWGARKQACDLYVAAFLRRKTFRIDGLSRAQTPDLVPTSLDVRTALFGGMPDARLCTLAATLAHEARAFHWPLEFPTAISRGGFDAVLGNPPWERIKLLEQEFFAARDPEIAQAPNAAARERLIEKLNEAAPATREHALSEEFLAAKRTSEASSAFARVEAGDGGRFPLTGRGDINTYALFAELFANLVSKRGRAGVIVPTGIATDDTYKVFFGHLVTEERLQSLMSFYEIRKWFRGTEDRKEFSLITVAGEATGSASFLFSAESPQDWSNTERRFSLSAKEIAGINPNTKTAPVFRSRSDAELTAKISDRVPVLIDEATGDNPWGVSFMSMFHMSNDSGLFRTAAQLAAAGFVREGIDWILSDRTTVQQDKNIVENFSSKQDIAIGGQSQSHINRYVPLYEGKMIHHYDHRYGDAAGLLVKPENAPLPRPALQQLSDHSFEVSSWYFVSSDEVLKRTKDVRQDWLLGWRDITNRTAERTVILSAYPKKAAGNNLPNVLFGGTINSAQKAAFISNLSSIVLDFLARHKIGGTHLNYFIIKQLPVLPPSFYNAADLAFIVPRVLELTYTSQSMALFARDLGYNGSPFVWDEERRAQLRAELDAWYAHAYGLTRDELRYVLDPSDAKGPDYPSETFRVLKKNEEVRFREYRTRRLVLAAYDQLAEGRIAAE